MKVRVGQSAIAEKLRWYRSFSCLACGAFEEDGEGLPPDDLRTLLVQSGGLWRVEIDQAHRVLATQTFMHVFKLTLREAVARLSDHCRAFVGTRCEAEWIAAHLVAYSVSVQIIRELDESLPPSV